MQRAFGGQNNPFHESGKKWFLLLTFLLAIYRVQTPENHCQGFRLGNFSLTNANGCTYLKRIVPIAPTLFLMIIFCQIIAHWICTKRIGRFGMQLRPLDQQIQNAKEHKQGPRFYISTTIYSGPWMQKISQSILSRHPLMSQHGQPACWQNAPPSHHCQHIWATLSFFEHHGIKTLLCKLTNSFQYADGII